MWPWHGAGHALPTTGAAACYIRPVKLRPLLPAPRGPVPSLSPIITWGSCFNRGIPCLLPTTGGTGRERKMPPFTCLQLLCPSRGQRTPSTTPGRGPFGNRVEGGPFDQPSLLGSGLGGATRQSPACCWFPHTPAPVKVTLSCTCPDRCPELRDQEPPGVQVTDREGKGDSEVGTWTRGGGRE